MSNLVNGARAFAAPRVLSVPWGTADARWERPCPTLPEPDGGSSRAQLWTVVGGFVLLSALMVQRVGIELRAAEFVDVIVGLAVVVGLAILRSRITAEAVRRLCDFFETLTLMGILSLAAAFSSIGIAAMTTGYADSMLGFADAWIGLEWEAAYRFVADHPTAQSLGRIAYRSIFWTPLFLLACLCGIGRCALARRLVIVYTSRWSSPSSSSRPRPRRDR